MGKNLKKRNIYCNVEMTLEAHKYAGSKSTSTNADIS